MDRREELRTMARLHRAVSQEWDENRGMFLEKPYHDWTSHAADEYRGAAVIEDQMNNDDVRAIAERRAKESQESRRNLARDVGL